MSFRYFGCIVFILISSVIKIDAQISKTSKISDNSHFLGNTARGINKGETFFKSVDLLHHKLEYGATEHLKVSGGLVYFPRYLNPTASLGLQLDTDLNDIVSIAISTESYMPLSSDSGIDFVSFNQGLVTYHFDNFTSTLGIGAAVSEEDVSLMAQLSFIIPINEKWILLSENYWAYDPTDNTYEDRFFFVSMGARYLFEKIYIDAGILNTILIGGDGNAFLTVPLLGIGYRF